MALRVAFEFFSDRVSPSFRGVRRRAVAGMNAAGWRKMMKDTGLFKGGGGLAKAAVIYEEVAGKRSMDFDSFKSALNIVGMRKKTRKEDVSAFIIHMANTLRDSDSLTSAESSIRSNIQQQKATAAGGGGKASKIIKAAKKIKSNNNNKATKGGEVSTRSIGSASSSSSTIATLEEGSSSSFSLPPLNNPSKPKKAGGAGGGGAGSSFASFAKGNQANSAYEDQVKNSLLKINASLRERKETSEEDLVANGFSWEKKERFTTKLRDDAFTWDWGN